MPILTNMRIFHSARRCRFPRFHVLVSTVSTIQRSFLPRARRPTAYGSPPLLRGPRSPASSGGGDAHSTRGKTSPFCRRSGALASLVPRREGKTATRHARLTRERPADAHAGAQAGASISPTGCGRRFRGALRPAPTPPPNASRRGGRPPPSSRLLPKMSKRQQKTEQSQSCRPSLRPSPTRPPPPLPS